jgi:hypothetical protein
MFELCIEEPGYFPLPSADPQWGEVQVWRDTDGRVCAYGGRADGKSWMHFPHVASFRFSTCQDVVRAVPQLGVENELVRDLFYRSVLPMALQASGSEVLHASGVVTSQGAVAFCANSGTGKSTIATALSRRGYRPFADDAVAVVYSAEGVRVRPLPFHLRLWPESSPFVASGGTAYKNPSTSALLPSSEESLPLAALFVLERVADADAPVQSMRLSPSEAFVSLLAHAYCFDLGNVDRNRAMMESYLTLAKEVPVFRLAFRPGLGDYPTVLDEVERLISKLPTVSL